MKARPMHVCSARREGKGALSARKTHRAPMPRARHTSGRSLGAAAQERCAAVRSRRRSAARKSARVTAPDAREPASCRRFSPSAQRRARQADARERARAAAGRRGGCARRCAHAARCFSAAGEGTRLDRAVHGENLEHAGEHGRHGCGCGPPRGARPAAAAAEAASGAALDARPRCALSAARAARAATRRGA
jgi:hypothetical protein